MKTKSVSVFICVHMWLMCSAQTKEAPSTYTLGPDDQILIKVLDAEEIPANTPIRIDQRGTITLPMVGRLKASGLTTEQLERELETRLKKYIQSPDVTVNLVEMRSQPISILGSVQTPGVHQLQGKKTLFEVLSLAGGLRPDAGYSVRITRRKEWGPIPLPDAKDDPSGEFSIASLNVKSIMDASNPTDNIQVKPNDVISVPRAQIVYVTGAVRKSGGFVLGEKETMSALQVLSLAEGFDRFADKEHAKIMRAVSGSETRTEIPIDLKSLLAGKGKDIPLQADDLLFVPLSGRKAAVAKTMETALGLGTSITSGLIIWRR